MLRNLLIISLFLSLPAAALAKKRTLPIENVASIADLIVAGEIVSVENNVYQFKIAETIKGKSPAIITVQQFKEWTCDVRYAKATKGQQLFLFLKKVNGKLEPVNGSTGELPVINNKVTLASESQDLGCYQSPPYQLSVEEFSAGIKGFIHLFAIIDNNNEGKRAYFLQKGTEKDLEKFIAAGSFSKWLYEKLHRNYKIIKS